MFSCLFSPTKAFAESAEIWLTLAFFVSTLAVVVGLVGEYRDEKDGSWWKRHALLAELLVLLGVAGEFFFEGGAFWYSLKAHALDEIAIIDAQNKATTAVEQAESLGVKVDTLPTFVAQKEGEIDGQINAFKGFATEEKQYADKAIADLSDKQTELAKARNDAVTAANNAKADIAKAEDALAKEAAIRDQIVAMYTPRSILPDKQSAFVQNLKSFSGLTANVLTPAQNDADAGPLGTILVTLLTQAGWKVGSGVPGSGWSKMVLVCTGDHPSERVSAAALSLVLALRANGVQSFINPQMGPDIPMSGFSSTVPNPDMTILVGARQ